MTSQIWVADFETVVYDGQDSTDVWSAGYMNINSDDVTIDNNMDTFMLKLLNSRVNIKCYFHNLKFDGSFILQWLHNHHYQQALNGDAFIKLKDMTKSTYKYLVSDRGVFYSITIKNAKGKAIEFLDSYKLLPFSLDNIAKSFRLEHQKGSIVYKGKRKAYSFLTDEEKEYQKNDVLILRDAIRFMIKNGHTKTTIGSCCLAEYKKIAGPEYRRWFTRVDLNRLPNGQTEDEFVRQSYKGAWCYCREEKANKVFYNGFTLDVSSLYPFVMSSPYRYPVGNGKWIDEESWNREKNDEYKYYFLKFKCRFKLKDGYLPFVQIKNNALYDGTVMQRQSKIEWWTGNVIDETVELTFTKTDWERFIEFYDYWDFEFLGCVTYETEVGIFDDYINKYKKIKENSKGAERTLAKLFSNNLYGKLATSPNSSYKIAYFDDGVLKWRTVLEKAKKTVYIPAGSAITAYARDYTIRSAQKNYKHFIYADTDSMHLDCPLCLVKGVNIHPTRYGDWKIERQWKKGLFVRQKTYVEEDLNGEIFVTCAGMPKQAKAVFVDKVKMEELTLEDFKVGLKVPGKLMFKQIKGGAVLIDADFTMKEKKTKTVPFVR